MQETSEEEIVEAVSAAKNNVADTVGLERIDDAVKLRFLCERQVVSAEGSYGVGLFMVAGARFRMKDGVGL